MAAGAFSRIILISSVAALTLTSATPLASRKPVPTNPTTTVSTSPVHCAVGEVRDDRYRPNAKRGSAIPNGATHLPVPPPSKAVQPSVAPTAQWHVGAEAGRSITYPYPGPRPHIEDRERYAGKDIAAIKSVAAEPVSTFSVDVDTGSYANVRRFLTQGQMPPAAAVRTEEMLNYFRYDYALPQDRDRPFGVTTDVAATPWNRSTQLLRIGIKGYDLPRAKRPPTNLVFLVDVSGSMMSHDKLPLVKTALSMLADRLSPQDKISIVVYAGAAGIVLEPTSSARYVKQALDCLQAGGSTAGGQGMELAYATAKANFIRGGVNRVIMATDGDFNVGISSNEGIEAIVTKHREAGITLTALGFGQGNYNEAMMERIADVGNGNYAYIDSAIEAQKVLDEEMAATLFTIAKDVKIQIEFNPKAVKEYRLIGYENRLLKEEDFDNDKVDAGDIGAGHQVTALYEIVPANTRGWLPQRRYEDNRVAAPPVTNIGELAWLKLRYKLPDGNRSMLIEQAVRARVVSAPTGDLAFAAAVAAYGQKLRGDKHLSEFSWDDIRELAGEPRGYLRTEFIKLADIAASLSGKGGGPD